MSKIVLRIVNSTLCLYALFCIGLLTWAVMYSGSGDGDTLEHVHSSWLVYHGKIPYKDFFQHHNPLLWYIAAPLVGAFEYSLRAVDAVNYLTVFTTAITMVFIFLINKNYISNAFGGLVSASFFAIPHDSLFSKDFKPDNFMVCALVIGIYFLLRHIKKKDLLSLALSFLSFFISFMYTQKAALILLGIGVLILYLIYEKQISIENCIYSALFPILLYILYLGYLYHHNVLLMYFKANFELNSHIPAVFDVRRFIYPGFEMIVPILFSMIGCALFLYKDNLYAKICGIIFILEYIIRLFYFTPFVYYYAFLHAISSIYAGYTIYRICDKYKHFIWLVVTYFVVLGASYVHRYSYRITVGDNYKYGASGFVLSITNPCDYILNGYRIGYNLFGKDVDYIWNLLGQIDVIASTIGIRPLADLETLIREKRPKVIYGKNYYDTYLEYRGQIGVHPIHWISSHLLNEMYVPLERDDLYILKPEYQKYDCRYNPRTKTYEYYD